MESLGSPAYRAKVGTNGNFILMHSVGSIPHGQEIDVPLNYADYYFLEGEIWKKSKPCLTYTLAGYVHALMPSGI